MARGCRPDDFFDTSWMSNCWRTPYYPEDTDCNGTKTSTSRDEREHSRYGNGSVTAIFVFAPLAP